VLAKWNYVVFGWAVIAAVIAVAGFAVAFDDLT